MPLNRLRECEQKSLMHPVCTLPCERVESESGRLTDSRWLNGQECLRLFSWTDERNGRQTDDAVWARMARKSGGLLLVEIKASLSRAQTSRSHHRLEDSWKTKHGA